MAKAKMNKYSLSSYTIKIMFPDVDNGNYPGEGIEGNFPTIIVGGEGNYLGTAGVERATDLWDIEADPTGAYVFSQNLDRHGKVKLDIKQVADTVMNLYYYAREIFERTDLEGGAYIEISRNGDPIVQCEDCMITKIPDMDFKEKVDDLTFEFLSGEIKYTNNFAKL